MSLRDVIEGFKAVSNAGLLEPGTPRATRLFLGNVLRGDFHPSTLWAVNAANLLEKEALVYKDRRFTWAQVNARINRLVHGLQAMGIRPGDRVAYMLKNSNERIGESIRGRPRVVSSQWPFPVFRRPGRPRTMQLMSSRGPCYREISPCSCTGTPRSDFP